ncbi:MAG: hypothetical protein MJ062_03450 [Oscillospiraceae bacterium]|nr:hypothetical protein [Oscillospiraceae bacterium]
MKTTIQRTAAALTAAAAVLMMCPSYAAFAETECAWPWQQNQNDCQTYTGDYVYYEYEPGKVYSSDADLGYIIMPAGMDIGEGEDNELGLLPLDSGELIVDSQGRISAKEIGEYSLVAQLKDGYYWKVNWWEEPDTSDKAISFVIGSINLGTPTFVQDTLPYQKGVAQSPKLEKDFSTYCTAEGTFSAEEPGTYSITYRMKPEYADHYHLNFSDYATLYYTIAECTHETPEGVSYYENGICTNCGKNSEPKINDNGTPDNLHDDYCEISNFGELSWYFENKRQIEWDPYTEYDLGAKLTANIAADGQTLPERDLKSAVFDGQGHVISGLENEYLFKENRYGSTICNLGLTDGNATIVQTNEGEITYCFVEGNYLVNNNGRDESAYDPTETTVDAVISNCYCVGNGSFGAICELQYDNGSIENCYYNPTSDHAMAYKIMKYNESTTWYDYLPVTEAEDSEVTAFDSRYAISGVLGRMMNDKLGSDVWFQNFDNGEEPDEFPVPNSEHGTIYVVDDCQGVGKTGTNDSTKESAHVGQATDGICDVCGAYEEPQYDEENGGCQIKNEGNLLWYAEQLNKGEELDAVLCNDITLNESLLNESGALANSSAEEWTPMNAKNLTFDGQGYTISGLYVDNAEEDAAPSGLFGTLENCTVKNVVVADSYISNASSTGGIAGKATGTSTIQNCAFNGTIEADGSTTAGAVVGECEDTAAVESCLSILANKAELDTVGSAASADAENCVTLNDTSAESLKNGETAKKLGDGWGQQIGVDAMPTLGGMPVYMVSLSTDSEKISLPETVYTNSDAGILNQVLAGLDTANEYKYINVDNDEELSVPLSKISSDCKVKVSLVIHSIELDTSKKTSFSVKRGKAMSDISLAEYVTNASAVNGVSFYVNSTTDYGLYIDGNVLKGTPSVVGTFDLQIDIIAGNGKKESIILQFTSAKGPAANTATPTAAPLQYGQKLSDSRLSDAAWQWADASIVPSVNGGEYLAYCAADDENYDYSLINGYNAETHRIERKIAVSVSNENVILDTASVTLNGDIGMNFYLVIPQGIADGATVTLNDEEFGVAGAKQSDGRYKFTYWVNAKEMHDDIVLVLNDAEGTAVTLFNNKGENKGTSLTICVADYLNAIKDRTDALGELGRKMLNYGEYAQIHFGYNLEAFTPMSDADSEAYLSAADSVDFTKYAATKTGDLPEGLTLRSMSLLLKTETTARLSFETEKSIANYAFKLDNASVTPKNFADTKEYAVDVFNIAAKDLDETHTVQVGDCTITYSALSYVNAVHKNPPTAAMDNLVKALYLYWEAAEAYFSTAN